MLITACGTPELQSYVCTKSLYVAAASPGMFDTLICEALVRGYVPNAGDVVPPPRSTDSNGAGPEVQKRPAASLSTRSPLLL